MPNLLWFRWRRSKGGYSIREDTPTASERRKLREYINVHKKLLEESEKANAFSEWHLIKDMYKRQFEYAHLCLYPNSQEMEEYEPLKECSGLFREFANLKDSPEQYLRFVNDYGLLHRPSRYGSKVSAPNIFGGLNPWNSDRESMKRMVAEWEKCVSNESVDKFIECYSGKFGKISLVLRKSFDNTQPALYLSPANLTNAMELQFFQTISSNLQVQRCAVCPKWFTFGAGTGRRKSAHYCSDRCRKTAWLASQNKSKK